MSRKNLTTKEFIEKANKVHNNKYDYSLVEYVNYETKIKIICPIHGEFLQTPLNHLQGHGCKLCGKEKSKIKPKLNLKELLQQLKNIFNDKYDYSNILEYLGLKRVYKIKCNQCNNFFFRTMEEHLSKKRGCPYCKNLN
jgi:Zn finger protein HypA/HybF involved in hydrogenase expression